MLVECICKNPKTLFSSKKIKYTCKYVMYTVPPSVVVHEPALHASSHTDYEYIE